MKIQLKRSNVLENNAAKEPTAAQMEYGELAVNYNTDDPAIFLKDSNDNIIRISGVNNISDDGQVEIPANPNPPSDPLAGNLWYNPVDGRLYIYYVDDNSSQWVDASPDSWQPTVIPNPENPTSQPDTLDDRYVMVTGDNMTGDLTLGTDKITLNATDGSSSFAGPITGTGGLVIDRTGPGSSVFLGKNNGTTNVTMLARGSATFAGDIGIGGTLPSAPNISLAADGSAHFKSGDQDTLSSVVISNDGSVSNGYVSLWNNGTNNAGVGINGSGTASNIGLYLNHAGTRNFSVAYDGSATFAGDVTVATNKFQIDSSTGTLRTANTLEFYANDITAVPPIATVDRIGSTGEIMLNSDPGSRLSGSGIRFMVDSNIFAYLDEGGDFKIGDGANVTPTITLFKSGSATFAGSIKSINGQTVTLQADSGNSYLDSTSGMVFRTNGTTPSAVVTPSGDLFVGGGNSLVSANPSGNIELNADGSASFGANAEWADGTVGARRSRSGWTFSAGIDSSVSTPSGYLATCGAASPTSSALKVESNHSALGGSGKIDAASINFDGSATFTGQINGTTVGTSDARFKENITPAKPQLADVVALGGILKNYDWTNEAPVNEELRSVRQLGLVAQEVEDICPSLVKDINQTKTMEITPAVIGPKGRVITEAVTSEVDDSYKGLSQDALIMKLIGAVSELSAEVQALKDAA